MPSKQIREILDQVARCNKACLLVSDPFSSRRMIRGSVLLTKYMAEHESKFRETLASYEADATKALLDTWLQFGNEEEILKRIEHISFEGLRTPEQLLQTALQIQRDLVQLYRELADATSVPEVQDLFNNLITLEENKGRHYARAVSEMMTG